MRAALALARRGLGTVWPNPAVGCVLTGRDGRVVGRGWTQAGGRPHAETEALRRAGGKAAGGTAYVTLEPCSHHGKTPPCADSLVAAGVTRAVVACEDPDPRVSGSGIAKLREAGIAVAVGLFAEEARELNAGFFHRILDKRPLVTLKIASTMDGRIATHRGESRWITGARARELAHALRADHDAILVGVGTATADNPELTCRLPGLADRSPVRVVLDGRMRMPLTLKLVASAKQVPTWLVGLAGTAAERRGAFVDCGVELIEVKANAAGHPSLAEAMAAMAERGITRLLVEGGSMVSAAFLRDALVDRVVWFRSPDIIGGDGVPATQPFGVDKLADKARFRRTAVFEADNDLVEIYQRIDPAH